MALSFIVLTLLRKKGVKAMAKTDISGLPGNVRAVLREASMDSGKGQYSTYEYYKRALIKLYMTPWDYRKAIKALADILEV